MCYQNAVASGAQGRIVLQQGILVLLLPAVTLFIGIFIVIYRRRNQAREPVSQLPDPTVGPNDVAGSF
jgi:hypothetical protein